MTVFVYVNISKLSGDPGHIKVFANVNAAKKWFEDNDHEGVGIRTPLAPPRSRAGVIEADEAAFHRKRSFCPTLLLVG
jgi:hypothetical protein